MHPKFPDFLSVLGFGFLDGRQGILELGHGFLVLWAEIVAEHDNLPRIIGLKLRETLSEIQVKRADFRILNVSGLGIIFFVEVEKVRSQSALCLARSEETCGENEPAEAFPSFHIMAVY